MERFGKSKLSALVLVAALLCLAPAALAAPLKVAVTIPPQVFFAQKLGGSLLEITAMVPPGGNPHTYEPKPRQLAALAKAKLYFAVGGMEFEEAWLPRFKSANPQLTVVESGHGITRLAMEGKHDHGHDEAGHKEHAEEHGHDKAEHKEHAEEHGHDEAGHKEHAEEHDHDHEGLDPHIWTAPLNVKHMAHEMLEALIKADPEHKAQYQANYAKFAAELDALDHELKDLFGQLPGEPHLLVYHPAWGYFCHAYGLEQIAVEKEGKAPGPKGLQAIISQAKKYQAKVVFVQPQFSTKSAQLVASAIKGQVIAIDPLALDWESNLRKVARQIKEAIK
jgi:zinc transport system substrate-binding protein